MSPPGVIGTVSDERPGSKTRPPRAPSGPDGRGTATGPEADAVERAALRRKLRGLRAERDRLRAERDRLRREQARYERLLADPDRRREPPRRHRADRTARERAVDAVRGWLGRLRDGVGGAVGG